MRESNHRIDFSEKIITLNIPRSVNPCNIENSVESNENNTHPQIKKKPIASKDLRYLLNYDVGISIY